MNETISKFNYPYTLLQEYSHWVVLLRPKQVTIGSMILACKGEVACLPDLSIESLVEFRKITSDLEISLRKGFNYDKINYLLLMMIDKHVHFHVIPRYSTPRDFNGKKFADLAWPKPPDVTQSLELDASEFEDLRKYLVSHWPLSV